MAVLTVLTLNVAHGAPFPVPLPFLRPRGRLLRTLEGVAALLAHEGADVVALQEVDRPALFGGRVDQLALLAGRAGYPHLLHGPHLRVPGLFCQGTALLSRLPLQAPQWCHFGPHRAVDKGLVVATVALGDGRAVDVASVHLDPFSLAKRHRQLEVLQAALARRAPRPLVLLGDLNTRRGTAGGEVARLGEGLGLRTLQPEAGEPTYPAARPRHRLDWILASPPLQLGAYRTLPTPVSDHLAVRAEVRW